MTDNLYREPEDVLRAEMDHLKARLKEELAEVKAYAELRDNRDDALEDLIADAEDDARATKALIADYRAAIKALPK